MLFTCAHAYTRTTHAHARALYLDIQAKQTLSCAHTHAYYKEYIYAGAHTRTHAPRSERIYTVYITTIRGQSALNSTENEPATSFCIRHTPRSPVPSIMCKCFLILPAFFEKKSRTTLDHLDAVCMSFIVFRLHLIFCIYVIFRRKCVEFGYICKATFYYNKSLYLFASL